MLDLEKMFTIANRDTRSDINEHLPTLLKYGRSVGHITEFGVRGGCSTLAWWYAWPVTLRCYDIAPCEAHDFFMSKMGNPDWLDYKFIQADVLEIEIEETDLLFIDTYHTYTQLSKELALHGNKSRKYLIFHDTVTFGKRGEDYKKPGLIQAINEFFWDNKHWSIKEIFSNNNGLLVLERSS